MEENILAKSCLYFMMLMLIGSSLKAQENKKLPRSADTTLFDEYRANDWQLLNAYISTNTRNDSADLELLIISDKKDIDWSKEQLLGRIKLPRFLPGKRTELSYQLMDNVYKVRIEPGGKCFLSLIKGSAPAGDPVILPVRVMYAL